MVGISPVFGQPRAATEPALAPAAPTLRLLLVVVALGGVMARAETAGVEQLSRLSLEQLASVEVTSVSRSAQRLSSAPATIFVISRDDMLRSGATRLADALRLAPNLQVTQLTSSNHVVSARGFGGSPQAQNFSNKLLVLVDGRSVYSPLFSSIYYDAQDVLLDDVERIEVISGPGATQWGANAMNGVINVITRGAALTQGLLARAGGGTDERSASLRLGGGAGGDAAWRVYAKGFGVDALRRADGSSVEDDWQRAQAGFRVDWARGPDSVTTQGDLYDGDLGLASTPDSTSVRGANLLARWRREQGEAQWQVQAYYDQTERAAPPGGVAFVLRTWDLDLQRRLRPRGRHAILLGAGYRLNRYAITNSTALAFEPPRRALGFGNLSVQDVITLGRDLQLSAALKLEQDPYGGWTALPDLRLSWQPEDANLLWAGVSRGVRAATPFDVDVVERLNGQVFLRGNPQFRGEKVLAWQLGWRGRPSPRVAITATAFYNDHDDLRSIEGATSSSLLPLTWGNLMEGATYGFEAWASLQLTPWWRVTPGLRTLEKRLRFEPASRRLLGVGQAGNDPRRQASLQSSMDLGARVTLDARWRWVGELPQPVTPAYQELDLRLGWQVTDALDLAVRGQNLLHGRHREFAAPDGEEIGRSVFAELRWRR